MPILTLRRDYKSKYLKDFEDKSQRPEKKQLYSFQ